MTVGALWTKEELERWAEGIDKAALRGALPAEISGISIDSRSLRQGEAFFAIKGERFDGHDYLSQAAAQGANLLVIDAARRHLANGAGAACLIVPDVLAALRALAAAARARLKPQAKVAVITGSVGKTTVKEMLAAALESFGAAHKSPASFNNHWGVPLTLARMPRETNYAVFEIGMNHAGEITPLVQLVRPHLALITKIAAAHRGHFNSLEEIAAAKAEIFSGSERNGVALLNRDDEFYPFLAEKARAAGSAVLSFGRSGESFYQISAESETEAGIKFRFSAGKRPAGDFSLAARGAHMALNAAAVLAAVSELVIRPKTAALQKHLKTLPGGDAGRAYEKEIEPLRQRAKAALAKFTAPEGRGARYLLPLPQGGGRFALIDESYNANPASMRAALSVLAREKGRKIAVLGDMLELGAAARAEHEALAAPLQASGAARVFLIGRAMGALAAKLQQSGIKVSHHAAAAAVIPFLKAELQDGDCVMIKSSNSLNAGKIVTALRELSQ